MSDQRCPYCGHLVDDQPGPLRTEPGIIRDDAEVETFNRIRITDLTGEPFHDWPLIVARFQNTLPWLIEVIMSDPAITRYLKIKNEDTTPPAAGPSQLWQDLDAVRPHLSKIVQAGQFVYGYQSRIAEALGIPNQGSYRRRIQNVARALERTLIKTSTQNSTSSTDSIAPSQVQNSPNRRAA